MKQTALLVGINRYEDDSIVNLAYAEQDALELYAFLKRTALYDEVRHLPASEADEDRILNAATHLTDHLRPGDLFVFYFAGHGIQYHGRHLLLCPQVRFHRLEFGHHTVPVDLLKKETARSGVSRVFVLDACRGNLLATREGTAQGFQGARGLRDIVSASPPQEGPLSILCSCDEGRQAQEVPSLEQGLFSRALLEEFESAARDGGELRLDDHLEQALRERMSRLARDNDLPLLDQRPWIQRSGETPALLYGRPKEPSLAGLPPAQARAPGPPPVLPGHRTPEIQPSPLEPRPGPAVTDGPAQQTPKAEPNGPSVRPSPARENLTADPARLVRVTLRSERRWIEEDAIYSVFVDGIEAGRISNGGVSSFSVKPGRRALTVRYASYPRAWRRYLHRHPLDLSSAPLDMDLDPGSERVVDCDVNELSWLAAIPGLHLIMMMLIEFTPCRWLRLRQTAAPMPASAQPSAQVPPRISSINKQTPVSVPPQTPGKASAPPPPSPVSRPSEVRPAQPARSPALPPNQGSPPPARALKAHRGSTILALGILGFVTFGLAGISAWIEGSKDLDEMRAGIMDPSGWRMTRKGQKLGMVATILWAAIIFGKLRHFR
ncbi:MAG: caspase family protein [Limisphaerales bacterium]